MPDTPYLPTHLQQPLLETADWLYQSSERLALQLNFAAQALMHTLTSGGKVLCAGEAEAATAPVETSIMTPNAAAAR